MSGTSQQMPRPAAPVPGNGQEQAAAARKARRKRSPSKARPVFIVAQVTDDNGHPMQFSKKNLKILTVELSAEKVLEITEGGEHENAFYVRLVVPPRQAQQPQRAATGEHNMTSPTA